MENIGSMSVAAITVICYLGALIVKATSINNKWIPVFCGVIGGNPPRRYRTADSAARENNQNMHSISPRR